MSSLPVSDSLIAEYSGRAPWPPTPDEYFVIDGPEQERSAVEPEIQGDPEIYANNAATSRLPQVNLSILTNLPFDTTDVDRLIPPLVSNLFDGGAWRDQKIARLTVTSAEVYALQLDSLLPLIAERTQRTGETTWSVDGEILDVLRGLVGATESVIRFDVISEVVYARSVDTAVAHRAISETDNPLYLDELDADGDGDPDGVDSEDSATQTAEIESDTAIDPGIAPFARARAVNSVLIENDLAHAPGVETRLISITDESVVLRQIFRRPLAIGVRGVSISIDVHSGDVLSIDSLTATQR